MIGKVGTSLLGNSMIYLCIHSPVKNDWAHNKIPPKQQNIPPFSDRKVSLRADCVGCQLTITWYSAN